MKEFYRLVLLAALALVCVASAQEKNATAEERTGKGEKYLKSTPNKLRRHGQI